MSVTGRPRQFRNNAERQRAYRMRKTGRTCYETPPPAPSDPLTIAEQAEEAAGQEYDRVRLAFYQWCVIEDRYPDWSKTMYQLYDRWLTLHKAAAELRRKGKAQ